MVSGVRTALPSSQVRLGAMRGEDSAYAIEVGLRAWLYSEGENSWPYCTGDRLRLFVYGPEEPRQSLRSDQD